MTARPDSQPSFAVLCTSVFVRRFTLLAAASAALAFAPSSAPAQAADLAELVQGLGVTARVLVIAAHPDDEDTRLITWLARGRHVETAYLSLTRGDGGQNLIGNELGEALGAIRTEELLAARRIDGGRQYFTRAYDFGFSKSAEETYQHWPRDSVFGDVVRVVRAFRPHVIVAVFSGTPADGHGHHQVSGMLARAAYDSSGDVRRFPEASHGAAWTVSKFYRSANFRGEPTYRYNAGEYSPLRGRSYAEIAGESRSQHKSQGFGSLERKGYVPGAVRREGTRVNEATPAEREQSIFEGVDTALAGLKSYVSCPDGRARVDALVSAVEAARRELDLLRVEANVPRLAEVARRIGAAAPRLFGTSRPGDIRADCLPAGRQEQLEYLSGLEQTVQRLFRALVVASGVSAEAVTTRDVVARGDTIAVAIEIHNRGRFPFRIESVGGGAFVERTTSAAPLAILLPDSSIHLTRSYRDDFSEYPSQPLWLTGGRTGDMFVRGEPTAEFGPAGRGMLVSVRGSLLADGPQGAPLAPVRADAEMVHRFVHPSRGELRRPLAVAPAIAVALDRTVEYAPARTALDRTIRVTLRPAGSRPRQAKVTLRLPNGLTADSASRTVLLPDWAGRIVATANDSAARAASQSFAAQFLGQGGGAAAPVVEVSFRVRGTLPPGQHTVGAVVESEGETFTDGYVPVEYEHIRPLKLYRPAAIALRAVDVKLAPRMQVAYVPGVGDNVAPMLEQLGVPLTVLDAQTLAGTELSRFTAVVIGPRAFEAHPALAAQNPRLQAYARAGGTLVMQYQQYEVMRPGMLPYPLTIARPHDRVTLEDAPVTVLDPRSPLVNAPNRITQSDFDGWVQERALYMPRTFDARYAPVLAMQDPEMSEPNRGALLVAPLGRGTFVYTTLSFFRQLPAGNPGAARLFVNLLAAGSQGAAQP